MDVRFTVDAFPKDVFRGKVAQVRLDAAMTKNVVYYTVVVVIDSAGGKLLPYMTANVQFEIDSRRNVLRLPEQGAAVEAAVRTFGSRRTGSDWAAASLPLDHRLGWKTCMSRSFPGGCV